MVTFDCENDYNGASVGYVDCVATTVSGALQDQISGLPTVGYVTTAINSAVSTLRSELLTVSGSLQGQVNSLSSYVAAVSGSLQTQINQLYSQLIALSGSCCSGTSSGTDPGEDFHEVCVEMSQSSEVLLKAADVNVGIGMNGSWTILAWVKPSSSSPSGNNYILDIGPSAFTNAYGIEVYRSSSSDTLVVSTFGTDGNLYKSRNFNSFFSASAWVQVVITWDGTNLKVFKNGSEQSPSSQSNFSRTLGSSNSRVSLGGNRYADSGGPATLEGKHYSVAIWDVALGSSAITSIYNSGDGRFDLSANSGNYASSSDLLHWWKLGFDSADIGKDYGTHSTLVDVMSNAIAITSADIVADYPGI